MKTLRVLFAKLCEHGACCECDQAQADDFDGFQTEEFVAGHGKTCAGCQEDGDDVAECVLSGVRQTSGDAGYFEEVSKAEAAHQSCNWRQEQGYDDGYNDREHNLFEVGDRWF